MTKKPRKQSSKKSGGSAEPQTSAEAGHNQLNDDELQALFFQHKKLYEAKLAAKKKGDADLKNACKLIKAEGGKNQVGKIKTAIRLDTEEGEAEVRAELLETMQVARWVGASIGTQFDTFGGGAEEGDRPFEEGKRVGMAGEPCKPPYEPSAPDYQKWMDGYHKGQAVKAQGFKKPDDGEAGDGERLPRKEWQQQLREQNEQAERDIAAATRSKDVGTKPATHQVVE